MFLDKLHLLHSRSLALELERAWLINLAHNARLDKLGDLPPRTRRVLLKRDLVDIVLSRAYRKQEYRDYIRMDASDEAYSSLSSPSSLPRFHKDFFDCKPASRGDV